MHVRILGEKREAALAEAATLQSSVRAILDDLSCLLGKERDHEEPVLERVLENLKKVSQVGALGVWEGEKA